MTFAVYADLPRELTMPERSLIADALDAHAAGGGSVGRQRGPNDEIYFVVDAQSEDDARTMATRCMHAVLSECGLSLEFALTIQVQHTE